MIFVAFLYLRTVCILRSTPHGFLYTTIDFCVLSVFYSRHSTVYLWDTLVFYTQPFRYFYILQSISQVSEYTTLYLWALLVFYNRWLWSSCLLWSFSEFFPVINDRHLRSSRILQLASQVFRYCPVNLWVSPYFTVCVHGLLVFYSRPWRSYSIL